MVLPEAVKCPHCGFAVAEQVREQRRQAQAAYDQAMAARRQKSEQRRRDLYRFFTAKKLP